MPGYNPVSTKQQIYRTLQTTAYMLCFADAFFVPEHHPRVDNEDEKSAAHGHDRAHGEVVHGHGQKIVHEVHVLGEAV